MSQLQEQNLENNCCQVQASKQWDSFGKNTICTATKGLNIVWGDDKRYWKQVQIPKDSDTRLNYRHGMELIRVCWLEMKGTLNLEEVQNLMSPNKTYELFYIIKFKPEASGWKHSPVTLDLVTPNGQSINRVDNFDVYQKNEWNEVFGGEFTVGATMRGKVEFKMHETKSGLWKNGMVLHGVIIKPMN